MTFCGDLPFVPSGIHHHLLRTFAAGITATAGNDCPGADRKSFACFWAKLLRDAFTPGLAETVNGLSAPGDRGQTGEWHQTQQRAGTRRNDVKRGLRNGVAPYIPAAFCRDAGSAGHGATEAARPERSLQARVSRQGWKPARAETASLAPFTTARPARGTPGKGISRRTTKQTVIRAAEKRRTVAVAGTTTSSVTDK